MTLHPISIVDHVLDEYRSYLRTEFQARDSKLRQSLEEALDREKFLAQEPFFQAHRPFKAGKAWKDLPLEPKLAETMEKRASGYPAYLHQSEAIDHLLSPQASPLVITTGTGSGKTECFLMPVLENAIRDISVFSRSGLTALLVYPMNALANDQEGRIQDYLRESGFERAVTVKRYDRTTKMEERAAMQRNPPHILLTNYMMLEYLLVRPADRDALFANHRCRFIVLDEVHTYRGALGANVALLIRRLKAHLKNARQDWNSDFGDSGKRFPKVICIGTSATIKSVEEGGKTQEEVKRLRDESVQEFFGRLSGENPKTIRVLGEEIKDVEYPPEAAWASGLSGMTPPEHEDAEQVRKAMAKLAGLGEGASLEESVRRAKVVWFLSDLLAKKPMSLTDIVEAVWKQVPERAGVDKGELRKEIETALVAASSLPENLPGILRLRSHRFVRGGWKFHRCVDPLCGRLYAMGEGECSCGKKTAPLFLCRSCGAHALGFWGDRDDPDKGPLTPSDSSFRQYGNASTKAEWLIYESQSEQISEEEVEDDYQPPQKKKEMKGRPVVSGSFNPEDCCFSTKAGQYSVRATAAPARNTCLVCGATAGSGSILTPVSLGTSAAVRVLSEALVEILYEQNHAEQKEDPKQRLLVFADSRQDAAHQARFITYAGRYDRMRRRLVKVLEEAGQALTLEEVIRRLMVKGVEANDNQPAVKYDDPDFLPPPVQKKALAWEEAPLLDDLAVSAGYRATVFNLGLAGVIYDKLDKWVEQKGQELAQQLGINSKGLHHLCRCILDEIRTRRALSRPFLRYHPLNPNCPTEELSAADWERRNAVPNGYACTDDGQLLLYRNRPEIIDGVTLNNFWRKPGTGGRGPSIQRIFEHLLKRLGGIQPTEDDLLAVIQFLMGGPRFLSVEKLYGYSKVQNLIQVSAEVVRLSLVKPEHRMRSTLSNLKMPWAEAGLPCPKSDGVFELCPPEEFERNRYMQRIVSSTVQPLVAGEHTAQVTGEDRIDLEDNFKGPASESPVNVLSCSPTLEMGIDVGGLDAVVMRNIPPRPDNYAQRGGRAGRRSRIGIVLAYSRNRPHDSYFYDKPAEMIAGEIPAPVVSLGNRDVVVRHLNAIAFGAATPGLAGKMNTYITLQGDLEAANINALIKAFEKQFEYAAGLALQAWGTEILQPMGLGTVEELIAELEKQLDRIRNLFDRVRNQIIELDKLIQRWTELGTGDRGAQYAMALKRKILGIPADKQSADDREADDRTSGHPMRRLAEFGILPGYEFPSEPAALRLWGDSHEEEPISIERRFGISQYQPGATVHARGHKWRVEGLDLSSPWNPKGEAPGWHYNVCQGCQLRYGAQEHASCPRCGKPKQYERDIPAYEFGGFLARRNDTPVLEEEDRIASAAQVRSYPQWNGLVVSRWQLPTGWRAQLRKGEQIKWLNESAPPTEKDLREDTPRLHDKARGFYLCPSCGKVLKAPEPEKEGKGTQKAKKAKEKDDFGHGRDCNRAGEPPRPFALAVQSEAWTLRLVVTLPSSAEEGDYYKWGMSLGTALEIGMKRLYLLDDREISFELEDMWEIEGGKGKRGALTFIDPALGGSGFLERAAFELNLIAQRALEHLDHPDCESSCYRCLRSYQNQRYHEYLNWVHILPDLEIMAGEQSEQLAAEKGDDDDPRPWLEAYDAGVGSPLELQFLRLFERNGISVDKQVAIGPEPNGRPISQADFVVTGTKTAIYIDGAVFHIGQRLRRDRYIRQRLAAGSEGWKILVFRARDLQKPDEVLQTIRKCPDH